MRVRRLIGAMAVMAAGTVAAQVDVETAAVRLDDTAPMMRSVDEEGQLVDMADLTDGAPLVFVYGSAT